MLTGKTRFAIFFSQYAAMLLYALVWAHLDHVRDRVLSFTLLYVLVGIALCYVAVRAYLVLAKRLDDTWDAVWVTVDLVIISALVRITGGINSEAGLIYFWPLVTYSIQRRPRGAVAVGIASAVLYVAATWPADPGTVYAGKLGTRMFLLLVATVLAACYAAHEVARVEEIARLREKVGLADYRARLSQEMHDGIQHYLVSMTARLEIARKLMERDPVQAAKIAVALRFTIGKASDELRYLLRRLRSPIIEKKGFVDGLKEHIALFAERTGIAAAVEVCGDPTPLPPDVGQAAFRIVQEAATNAQKHGHAGELTVTLTFSPGMLKCAIEDDGAGFDPAETQDKSEIESGFGLPSMRQRAETLGGQLHISSSPGQGTTVAFEIPADGDDGGEDAEYHKDEADDS
jgi:signal transduction histidine kinase